MTTATRSGYRLRSATSHDAHLLWEWANDPAMRRQAFQAESIPWETHVAWYQEKLRDPTRCLIAIVETEGGTPVGQIRFDQGSEGLDVDISVAASHRGKGIGQGLLRQGVEEARKRWPPGTRVIAKVLVGNQRSFPLFARSGFVSIGLHTWQGKAVHVFEQVL